jgi:hypothetical protein
LTRRKERSGDVGGSEVEVGEAEDSRSVHSDSKVRKMCEKWRRPVV